MYCSKCGVENCDGPTHCANCGSVLMDAKNESVPGPPVAVGVPVETKTCGLATASLVMGLLSIFCSIFLAIPAIICGIIALVKINKSQGQLKGKGFAITGIVIPAIILVLTALLVPGLLRVKALAERMMCGVNLKGLSTAMKVYTMDYYDTLPTENWCDLLIEEADMSPKFFVCPCSDAIEGESCYAMNENIAGMNIDELPDNVVLLFETNKGLSEGARNTSIQTRRYYAFLKTRRHSHTNYNNDDPNEDFLVYGGRFNQYGGPEDVSLRHNNAGQHGCNVVYADGYVEFITEDRLADLQWTVE